MTWRYYLRELLNSDEFRHYKLICNNAKLYIVINQENELITTTDKLTEKHLRGIIDGYLRILKINDQFNTHEIVVIGTEHDEDLDVCLEEIVQSRLNNT